MDAPLKSNLLQGNVKRTSTMTDRQEERTLDSSWKRTVFGTFEHVLHRTAISRIALLPTVHASAVQNVEESKENSGTRSVKRIIIRDDSSNVPVTEDTQAETGWDRLNEAFFMSKQGISRELYEVMMMFLLGGMLGFVYGGLPASRHARQRYIQQSQASIYHSKLEATGSSYNAGSRGMIRYGYRWGWRTAMLAGGFHGISTAVAVYRNKQDLFCYTVAGVTTGILYRINLGLRGVVGGGFIGALLGIPCGVLLLGVQQIKGESFIEKCRREREEMREEERKEIELRMQVTPQMMEVMEESMQSSSHLLEEKSRVESTSSSS